MSVIRAITHVHTHFSYDSLVRPRDLVSKMVEHRVGLALIADHDSFEGSLEVNRLAASAPRPLIVPIAAEVKTELGDVIVVFDKLPVPSIESLKSWQELPRLVRELGGLIWLPHPFHGHKNVEAIAAEADVIEVYNARCTPAEDDAAADLCARFGKTPAYGADAHLLSESLWNTVEYEADAGTSPTSVLRRHPCQEHSRRVPTPNVELTQVIKGIKLRRPRLIVLAGVKCVLGCILGPQFRIRRRANKHA